MRIPAILTIAGATALIAATSVHAQDRVDVIITPQLRTQVQEYVVTQPPPPPVVLPDQYRIVVGEPLPPEVPLYPIEAVPEAQDYRYVVVENRTVLVDPVTRQVVEIIE